MDSSGGGGGGTGAPSAVSNSAAGGSGTYKGVNVNVANSGSPSVAPKISAATGAGARKLDKKGADDNLRRRNKFLKVAYNQLGDRYVWGAEGPDKFDCSGLVYYSAQKAGLSVPRLTADAYMDTFRRISSSEAMPGDVVGFGFGGHFSHIGIYAGSGRMIHAPNSDERIQVGSVSAQSYPPTFARIKGLAEGGVATQRTVAEIAEAGYPEAVIPLNNRGHDYMLNMYKAISREMVKEISTKQMGIPAVGGYSNQYINASTNFTGEITVKADDPGVMLKKLEQRKRRDALLKPSSARSS
jgi:cell wall-associated NlpC family hydrolase